MSRFRRFEIIETDPVPPIFIKKETSIFTPKPLTPCLPFEFEDYLDLLNPNPILIQDHLFLPAPFDDLIQITQTPFYTSTQRVQRRVEKQLTTESYLQSLSDRVAALEHGFDSLLPKTTKPKPKKLDRKYTWTAEIKSPEEDGVDRKYKISTEIKGKKEEKTYKWTAEIKGKGESSPISRTYTFQASTANAAGDSKKKEKEKNGVVSKKDKKTCDKTARVVEIEDEPVDQGAVVLRQVLFVFI